MGAFTKNQKKWTADKKGQEAALEKIKKYCSTVRLIAHTQMKLIPLKQKKAHIIELQVNGGDAAAKVDFARGLFEKQISISDIFAQDASWSPKGRLYWCVASVACVLHRRSWRPEGLPPPCRDQQEDLPRRKGLQDRGRQG